MQRAKAIFNEHFILIIALLVTVIVYSRFLYFGHISWDDPEMVFKNKAVRDLDLKTLFTHHYVGNYIPVTMFVHSFTWLFFENSDGAHHLINILIHLLNGLLVYQISNRLFKNKVFANIITVVFLLHPIQLESVGWISELKNVLSACFYLAGILSYLSFVETKKQKHYLLLLLYFILGCLSKSSVVVLPLTLICLDIFLLKSFSFKFILNKIPLLIGSVLFGLVNIKSQMADQFINYSHAFPYHERVGYAGFAVVKYFLAFLFPYNLSVLYPYPQNKIAAFIIGYGFVILLVSGLFLLFKKKKFDLFALILLALVNLLLVLQFVPFGEVLYADRYMYIPLIFFSFFVIYLVQQLKINLKIIVYLALVIFPVITFLRLDVWKNSVNLYSDILKKFPESFVALNSLGAELMMQNDDIKALEYLNKAVKVSPQNYKGFYNRGLLFLKTNQPDQAIKSFNQSLAIYDYNKSYVGRASAYYAKHDISKAMSDINYVLAKDPNNPKALFVLANCYNDLNKLDESISYYNKCIQLNSEDPDFYFKRAIAYGKKQDFKQCMNDLTICISFNETYFEAYYWRGVAKVNLNLSPCEDLKIAARNHIEPAVKAYNKYCQ